MSIIRRVKDEARGITGGGRGGGRGGGGYGGRSDDRYSRGDRGGDRHGYGGGARDYRDRGGNDRYDRGNRGGGGRDRYGERYSDSYDRHATTKLTTYALLLRVHSDEITAVADSHREYCYRIDFEAEKVWMCCQQILLLKLSKFFDKSLYRTAKVLTPSSFGRLGFL
jgi:hypothetical protein